MHSGSCLFEILILTDFLRAMRKKEEKKNIHIHLFEDDPSKFETLVNFFHTSNFISITPNLR